MIEDRYIERALELAGIHSETPESVKAVSHWTAHRSILAHARTLQQQEAQGQGEAHQPQADWLTQEAREALGFYADHDNWLESMWLPTAPCRKDGGAKARAALEKLREVGHA